MQVLKVEQDTLAGGVVITSAQDVLDVFGAMMHGLPLNRNAVKQDPDGQEIWRTMTAHFSNSKATHDLFAYQIGAAEHSLAGSTIYVQRSKLRGLRWLRQQGWRQPDGYVMWVFAPNARPDFFYETANALELQPALRRVIVEVLITGSQTCYEIDLFTLAGAFTMAGFEGLDVYWLSQEFWRRRNAKQSLVLPVRDDYLLVTLDIVNGTVGGAVDGFELGTDGLLKLQPLLGMQPTGKLVVEISAPRQLCSPREDPSRYTLVTDADHTREMAALATSLQQAFNYAIAS